MGDNLEASGLCKVYPLCHTSPCTRSLLKVTSVTPSASCAPGLHALLHRTLAQRLASAFNEQPSLGIRKGTQWNNCSRYVAATPALPPEVAANRLSFSIVYLSRHSEIHVRLASGDTIRRDQGAACVYARDAGGGARQ